MAQIKESEILSDELCDKLCAVAREKSKELGIDISFAIADRHGLPRAYRRYGDALVLSITLVPGKAYTAVQDKRGGFSSCRRCILNGYSDQ